MSVVAEEREAWNTSMMIAADDDDADDVGAWPSLSVMDTTHDKAPAVVKGTAEADAPSESAWILDSPESVVVDGGGGGGSGSFWSETAQAQAQSCQSQSRSPSSQSSPPPVAIITPRKKSKSRRSRHPAETGTPTTEAATTTVSTPATAASTATTSFAGFSPSPQPADALPESYVTMISNAFGSHADLYRDVLGISRNASPREVRIAYFKRGREVLSERPAGSGGGGIITTPEGRGGGSGSACAAVTISGGHISDLVRLKFQAVSMAYEIICNPMWLDTYERIQWLRRDSDDDDEDDNIDDDDSWRIGAGGSPSISSTRSLASSSALRRTSSTGSLRSRRTVGGVHWNEQVEELVFNQDPDEQRSNTKRKKKSKKKKKKKTGSKKKKKQKKRIAVEAGDDCDDLEKHLEQLDKEAEQNFVHDFFDDLEQSIDQLLNFNGEADRMDEDEDDDNGEEEEEEEEEEQDLSRPLVSQGSGPDSDEPFPTPNRERMPSDSEMQPSTTTKKRSSRKQELDIDDEEFEMYENHHPRGSKRITRASNNPFDDDEDDITPDVRQEATDSLVFESTPRQGDEDEEEDAFVPFPDFLHDGSRQRRSWGDAHPNACAPKFRPIPLDTDGLEDMPSPSSLRIDDEKTSKNHRRRRRRSSSLERQRSQRSVESSSTGRETQLSPQRVDSLRNQSNAPNSPRSVGSSHRTPTHSRSPNRSGSTEPRSPKSVGSSSSRRPSQNLSRKQVPPGPGGPGREGANEQARVGTIGGEEGEHVFALPYDEHFHISELHQEAPTPVFSNASMTSPRSPPRKTKNATQTKSSKSRFEGPKNIEVTKNYKNSFDGSDSAAHTIDDSVSTLSASVVQRHVNRDLTNSRYNETTAVSHRHMECVQEEDGITACSAAVNQDAVSPKNSTPPQPRPEPVEAVSPRSNSQTDPADMMFCFRWCVEEEDDDIARAMAGVEAQPDFSTFLMSYLNAMVSDLSRLGHSMQEKWESCAESADFLSANDLQGMLSILESEIEEVPDDIVQTLSQEFVPGSD